MSAALAYPAPTSPLYKLACDFVRAANNQDWALLETLLADDYSNQLHPSSIRTPGQDARVNKHQYIERGKQFIGEGGFVKALNVDIDHPVNVVEGKDCIVLQLVSNGVLNSGKAWPMEYLHIIRFNADQKISSVEHWQDSALAHAALPGAAYPTFGADGMVSNFKEATEAMKSQ